MRRAWTRSVGIPGREEADRHLAIGAGERGAGKIEELLILFRAKTTKRQAFGDRSQGGDRHPGPTRDVTQGSGTEATEIAATNVSQPLCFGHGGRPQPLISEPEEIGPAALPGSRRGHPNHIDPHPSALPSLLGDPGAGQSRDQLVTLTGRCCQLMAQDRGRLLVVDLIETPGAGGPQPPLSPRPAHPGGEQGIVTSGDDVNRASHQGSLHRASGNQGPCQLIAAKPGET